MPKQIQYIKNGEVVAQIDSSTTFGIPEHDSTNEVWVVPEQVTLWQLRGVLAAMGGGAEGDVGRGGGRY